MSAVPTPLLEIDTVRKAFPRPDGGELLVLDGVNLRMNEGEIVGLLGRSGSKRSRCRPRKSASARSRQST